MDISSELLPRAKILHICLVEEHKFISCEITNLNILILHYSQCTTSISHVVKSLTIYLGFAFKWILEIISLSIVATKLGAFSLQLNSTRQAAALFELFSLLFSFLPWILLQSKDLCSSFPHLKHLITLLRGRQMSSSEPVVVLRVNTVQQTKLCLYRTAINYYIVVHSMYRRNLETGTHTNMNE